MSEYFSYESWLKDYKDWKRCYESWLKDYEDWKRCYESWKKTIKNN